MNSLIPLPFYGRKILSKPENIWLCIIAAAARQHLCFKYSQKTTTTLDRTYGNAQDHGPLRKVVATTLTT